MMFMRRRVAKITKSIYHDQWDEYYEYTGMADLAREIKSEEKEMRK